MVWRRAVLALIGTCGALALTQACGSDGGSKPGFAGNAAAGAGGSGGSGGSAGEQQSDGGIPWPDGGASLDAGPGPSPGFDAGPPSDAGVEPFSCADKTPVAPGTQTIQLSSGGRSRSARLHVPANYDPRAGYPLVLSFHGFSSADWQQEILTNMNSRADARGVLVAYPSGVVTSWNAGDCCGTAWLDAVDDVQFVRDLLDTLERDYCVDPKRIYATGMSNGGFLSHRLACELSERIAAIAPVAGVLGIPPEECQPTRPVPVLQIHGTEDPLVPYNGGTAILNNLGVGIVFRSVADTMQFWQTHNGCSTFSEVFYQNGDTTCEAWGDCSDGAQTALCTVEGGGHTWPSGLPVPFLGKTTRDLDATETMLDFFEAHPLP